MKKKRLDPQEVRRQAIAVLSDGVDTRSLMDSAISIYVCEECRERSRILTPLQRS